MSDTHTSSVPSVVDPVDALKGWLDTFGEVPPVAPPTPHHDSPAAMHTAAHGLSPCPDCGGDIQSSRSYDGTEGYTCRGCHRFWNENQARSLLPRGPSCPKCQSEMRWRGSSSLSGLWPEGAWECTNQRCWHMAAPGGLAPNTFTDPDQSQSDLTFPEDWTYQSAWGDISQLMINDRVRSVTMPNREAVIREFAPNGFAKVEWLNVAGPYSARGATLPPEQLELVERNPKQLGFPQLWSVSSDTESDWEEGCWNCGSPDHWSEADSCPENEGSDKLS